MKARGGWHKQFKFTEEQRSELSKILRRDDDAVGKLLFAIELAVPLHNLDMQVFVKEGLETPREVRALLGRISRNAKQLYDDLENLDPMGSGNAFTYAITKLGADIDFMKPFMNRLLLVAGAAGGAVDLIGPAKRGRKASQVELNFIGYVGKMYQDFLKRRPAHSRGAQFTKFMSKVFEFVDPSNPRSYSDISKFTKKALANLKPTNDSQ